MLLDTDSADEYHRMLTLGLGEVRDRLARLDRVTTGVPPATVRDHVDAVDLDHPLRDARSALDELGPVWLDDAVWFHDPAYAAHLNCPVAVPALLGEVLLTAVNPSLDTWDQSAGATLIEQRLVRWTADRIGFVPASDGVFTSGGTQSNLQALHLARGRTAERLLADSPADARLPDVLPAMRILVSEVGHFSVTTSARLLGLGDEAVLPVACDDRRRMRVDALAAAVAGCRARKEVPIAVVATAGTTDFGSIDPLAAIARLCRDEDVWLHVDAAYGGGLLCSRRRRHLLDGVELADSVTVDFHKTFFQPVSSSAVLVRDAAALRHVRHHAEYLNPTDVDPERRPNQVDKSLQTTRRFDALKLWLTLRVEGPDAVGDAFDAVIDLAERGWRALRDDPRFEVVVRPTLSTLVLRYRPDPSWPAERVDAVNLAVRDDLFDAGVAAIARTRVDGRVHLKLTLLNPRTDLDQLRALLDVVARAARARADERSAA